MNLLIHGLLLTISSSLYAALSKIIIVVYYNSSESTNFDPFGGISFLREMRRKTITTPVIIVTQYEIFGEGEFQKTSTVIDEECKNGFNNYKGIIIYSSVNNEWKEKLVRMIGDIKNDKSIIC